MILPATPFSLIIYLAIKKGLRLTLVFPAASLLFWITTLVVSMGWITAEATLPDNEPITNGLIYFYTIPSDIIWYVFLIMLS